MQQATRTARPRRCGRLLNLAVRTRPYRIRHPSKPPALPAILNEKVRERLGPCATVTLLIKRKPTPLRRCWLKKRLMTKRSIQRFETKGQHRSVDSDRRSKHPRRVRPLIMGERCGCSFGVTDTPLPDTVNVLIRPGSGLTEVQQAAIAQHAHVRFQIESASSRVDTTSLLFALHSASHFRAYLVHDKSESPLVGAHSDGIDGVLHNCERAAPERLATVLVLPGQHQLWEMSLLMFGRADATLHIWKRRPTCPGGFRLTNSHRVGAIWVGGTL
jgi:hypothetical protein